MKKTKPGQSWFFVDESGDLNFYDKRKNWVVGQPGCSSLFIIGFVEIQNPRIIRSALASLRSEIASDPQFQSISSLSKTLKAFHAKDDHYTIRQRVFELLPSLDFRAEFILVRKEEMKKDYYERFNGKENNIYDQFSSMLFHNQLHRVERNYIYFAYRGSRARQIPLRNAIQHGIQEFESKCGTKIRSTYQIQAQTPSDEPCLSVIDYMIWALQRCYSTGDASYYELVANKVSLVLDRYHPSGTLQRYSRRRPLTLEDIFCAKKKLPSCS